VIVQVYLLDNYRTAIEALHDGNPVDFHRVEATCEKAQ
jgi:hypothetical protein